MNTILVRYKAIFKHSGIDKLPNGIADVEIFVQESPCFSAKLTADQEPYFEHIDRSAAIGNQLLKSINQMIQSPISNPSTSFL